VTPWRDPMQDVSLVIADAEAAEGTGLRASLVHFQDCRQFDGVDSFVGPSIKCRGYARAHHR
jgi:hypothetical protein